MICPNSPQCLAMTICYFQVCEDIDECLGPPQNGGCTANSHCLNTIVRPLKKLLYHSLIAGGHGCWRGIVLIRAPSAVEIVKLASQETRGEAARQPGSAPTGNPARVTPMESVWWREMAASAVGWAIRPSLDIKCMNHLLFLIISFTQ